MSDAYADEVQSETGGDWRKCDPGIVAGSLIGAINGPVIPDHEAKEVAEFLARHLLGMNQQLQMASAELNGINKVFEICRIQHQKKSVNPVDKFKTGLTHMNGPSMRKMMGGS